ncbi:TonB-linked SusC/RagA family outer membrane protein [Pedobacter africanus]|uniref:TonB-linked SusC/RagA family outer membrane protein n=1 Tax=Pedobacter africanus TaxID=151894 RepID=A0ACC6KQV6_9SPHI|nr:SusC/RagA family TonB-linked outer membrane protein [Pedobacter africanus]MDR6781507.1 TonB-linked SusC/RagA family outer membrane protein [Pedobacter africanus]
MKRKLSLLSGLCFMATIALAQVKGTVVDETQLPLPGVTVTVKNTKTVTTTDPNGAFSINAPSNATLVFSYIGYIGQEKQVNGNTLRIVLVSDSKALNEVVVTALGITKEKKTLVYSTQTVNTEELTKARELNVVNSLTGKVAGLDVVRSSSGLGGSSRVTLRGDRSISGNNQALMVVDGVPLDNSTAQAGRVNGGRDSGDGISSLNPDDIESINVLKGASATALYGSRASNGAIIITTKKGKQRKGVGISYTGGLQIEQPIFLQKFQTEYGQGASGIFSASGEQSWGPKLDGKMVPTWSKDPADAGKTNAYIAHPDNFRDFYSKGTNLVNSIALNAGTEQAQVYFSYTNTNATGIIDNNKLKRHNFNLRASGKLGERFTADLKATYLNQDIINRPGVGGGNDNPNLGIYRVPINIAPEDLQNYDYINGSGFLRQNYWNPGATAAANPYWAKNRNLADEERNRLTGFAALTYKILPSLNVMLRSGIDRYTDNGEFKWYNDTYVIAPQGDYQLNTRDVREINHDFLFSYNQNLSKAFTLNANFGGNIQKNDIVTTGTRNNSLIIENLFTVGNTNGSTPSRSIYQKEKQALYATADLSYKNYLTLTVTGRNDWSSTLPKGNNSYFFPSVGLSAVLSEMYKLPEFISFAKLRGSFAQTGNDADPYNLSQTYTSFQGGNSVTIGRDATKPIPGLKPEITTAQELGLEARFFNSRLGFDLTWYNSNSKNQLLAITLPAGSGWASQYINAGNIKNDGIEFTLNGSPVKTSSFKWDVSVNYAKNNNKVLEISPTLNEFLLTTAGDFMNTVKIVKGKPFGELYSRGYLRNASGQIIVDVNGLPVISGAQDVYVGNTRPDWTGSIVNKFSYKNFFTSFVISARMGGVVSSFTNANIYADGVAAKTAQNRDGFIFDGVFADGSKNNKQITAEQYWKKVGGRNTPAGEVFTYDASNIRLREFVLGYNLSGKLLNGKPFQSASISLTGRNLFFLLNRAEGFDPEQVIGSGNSTVGIEAFAPPTTRSFGLSLNLTF